MDTLYYSKLNSFDHSNNEKIRQEAVKAAKKWLNSHCNEKPKNANDGLACFDEVTEFKCTASELYGFIDNIRNIRGVEWQREVRQNQPDVLSACHHFMLGGK